ncbi:hypothetical protein [Roseicella frigidaeris]|uniref:DUF4089 domain-containing protein n=1 Tax=Roseicella frigidaeris TaxID=2230885 RepID=A0A327M671_9PROT|nr:hypothetical protein [Roseicella frigidaeris]RAI57792.1 hypothetical protein DOO78_17410 [Roseicella frigidaeris]
MSEERASEETTPEALAVLARQAGLDQLPGAYRAELLAAWRHVERMAARIPAARPYADEPAHVFDPTRFGAEG